MALFRTGLYVKNHSVEKVQVAKTPIASYNGNVTGLYIPEIIAEIVARQTGSGTPAPDNVRPIIGVSECNVVRCGKNILKTNGLTFANPSSTATANTTPRTWTRDSYCVGISHNNYYNTVPIDVYSVSDNEIVVKTTSSAYGVNIPITLARGISGKITLNANVSGGKITVSFYKEDGTFISSNDSPTLPRTVSIPSGTFWAVLGFVPTISQNPLVEISFTDIMIELSDTSSSYEPYTGNTYTIALGDTYYGGSLDVTNGVLTITVGTFKVGDLDWTAVTSNPPVFRAKTTDIPNLNYPASNADATTTIMERFLAKGYSPLSSTDYGRFAIAIQSNNRIVFVDNSVNTVEAFVEKYGNDIMYYPLATPITVQLTPTQVEQFLGANDVWADTGDVEVKFYNVIR